LRESTAVPVSREEYDMAFVGFMSSGVGRLARIVAGVAFIIFGALLGGGWFVLTVVGLVPLFAGVFDLCIFAPLLGQPLSGTTVRQQR
jgi:hypothetical protein